jgi:hypothetical protein
VRVRLFRLRLVGAGLAGLWAATSVVLLVWYRPGGPFDPAVAAAPIAGLLAALAALAWPPLARGTRASVFVGWLGLSSILLLAPSLLNLVGTVREGNASPFLPSPEAAYGWLLAVLGTCLYGGLGFARRVLGATALRRERMALGTVVALAVVGVAGGVSAVAALATELALREQAATTSDWGPTDQAVVPPVCADGASAGPGARVTVRADALVDGRSVGDAGLDGTRNGTDEAWDAWAQRRAPGSTSASGRAPYRFVRFAGSAWLQSGDSGWREVGGDEAAAPTLDDAVVALALSDRARLAAEDLGIELIGPARARHCRLLVDGPIALAAFPPLRWLIGQPVLATAPDLADWRGNLDWWVFADRELGMAEVTVSGAIPWNWQESGFQGSLRATLTARARDTSYRISRPVVP